MFTLAKPGNRMDSHISRNDNRNVRYITRFDNNFIFMGIMVSWLFKSYKVIMTFIIVLFILLSMIPVRVGTAASAPSGIRLSWTQDATNSTITILWETDSSGNPTEVQYGLTSSCEIGTETGFSFADSWGVYENHQVDLTGLSPNTKYFYKVSGDSGEWSAVYNFTTAPDSAINWTFLVAADSRSNYGDWDSVVQAMVTNTEARLLFFGGDILSDFDSQSEWYDWMYPAKQLISHVPFISNKGNHEDDSSGDPWDNFLNTYAFPSNEEYFSFDYGNAHFIVLNTEDSSDPTQKTWLESDLQAASSDPSNPWIFVSHHRPPYSSGGHDSSTSARSNFVPLYKDYGVDMVFSGHNHFYQRTYPLNCTNIDSPVISDWGKNFYYYPDTIYAVVGRAGAPAYAPNNGPGWFVEDTMSSELHYMKVDVYTNGSVHATTRYTDNVIFDDFWIIKNGTPPPPPPPPPPTNTTVLIQAGDDWRYSEVDPQPPSTPAWNENGFDDSSWLSGPAPLGFGDSTTYGTVLNDNDGSYYFRKTFNLDPGTEIQSAKLNVSSDNYAQVYLNGVMIDDDSGTNHEFAYWNRMRNVSPSAFQSGTNTVAVFVFNTGGSSDAYMDLDLIIKEPVSNGSNSPPTITFSDVTSAVDGVLYSQIYTATDPENDPLTWSLVSDASWLSIDPDTGELFGTPQLEDVGTYWVNVTVTDNQSAFDFHYFILTVDMVIPLSFGWNLVSLPLEIADNNLESVLQSIDGQYDAVQFYDASDSNDPWKHYHISKPIHLNDLSLINKTMGFWVHITNSDGVNLTIPGMKLSGIQNITLNKGWNLVGFPSTASQTLATATSNLIEPVHVMVMNKSRGYPHFTVVNENDFMEPKTGYWLLSPIKQVWTLGEENTLFFTTSGPDLVLNGNRVRFVGGNSYGILSGYLGIGYVTNTVANSTQRLVEAKDHHIRILRFWLDVAPSDYWFGEMWTQWTTPSDHSTYFAALDTMIQEAKANNIYIVPSFASAYDQWTTQGGGENFWIVGSATNILFKDWVSAIVTRYSSEPQIAFWELANEANYFCQFGSSIATQAEVITWAQDLYNHIKSNDSNHLIEGGWNNMGNMNMADFDALNNFLDLASHHIYDKDLYAYQSGRGISDPREAVDDYVGLFTNYSHDILNMPIIFGEFNGNLTEDPENPFVRWFFESCHNYTSDIALIWSWEEGYPTDDYLVTPTIRPVIAQDVSYWSQKFLGMI
jgi:hypothetical protein